jgi:hypothetical protein
MLENSKEEVLMEVKEREMLKMKEAFGIKKRGVLSILKVRNRDRKDKNE